MSAGSERPPPSGPDRVSDFRGAGGWGGVHGG